MIVTELKNEEALDLLADIIDPVAAIMQDEGFVKLARDKTTKKIQLVKYMLKNHASHIVEIFAICEGVPVSEYKGTILSMTKGLLDMLNNKELVDFFTSQGLLKGILSSGPATETTEAEEI